MPKCSVLIDDHLSPVELQILLSAISLLRGVQAVTIENEGKRANQPTIDSLQDHSPAAPYQSADLLDSDTQRYFIDEVIRWAVKKKHLQLEGVRHWSPEEIITQAVKIFESMSEQDKKLVGQKVSKHAERITINTNPNLR